MKDLITMEGASDKMTKVAANLATPPIEGDIVEGLVISVDKSAIYINLPPFGTGIIFGREYITARDLIRKVRVGDSIKAKVVDIRNEEGYIELSLKEARQALIWGEVEEAIKTKKVIGVTVQDANKGGLIMSWQGLQGFLPASQLSADHYPRVTDGDKMKILEELKKLIGKELAVTVIGATSDDGKLIFSEKGISSNASVSNSSSEKTSEAKTASAAKYKVGDVLDGEVTGVVDFGVFVKVQNDIEGLVHISEIDWSLVENPRQHYSVGDTVKVKVIEVKDGKISLSIKALKENPWVEAGKKYKKGDVVNGVVIKHNKHGALVSIEEGVAGLVHISEFANPAELKEKMELGKNYQFKITLFDAKDQKMTLTAKV